MNEGHPAFPRPEEAEATLGPLDRHRRDRRRGPRRRGCTGDIPASSTSSRRSPPMTRSSQGHITYVSPRVEGLVTEVMVDQDDRVEAGDAPGAARPRAVRGRRGAGRGGAGRGPGERRAVAGPGPFADRPGAGGLLPPQERAGDPARTDRHAGVPRSPPSGPASRADGSPRSTSGGSTTWSKRGSATQSELDQRNNTLKVASEQEKEAWAAIQETRAAARPAAGLQRSR